jgi:hypothetical protein
MGNLNIDPFYCLDPFYCPSEQLRDQWKRFITGWWNYFQLADRRWGVQNITGWTRRHIRKCFWLRWKTPKGRLNALKRQGVSYKSRGIAYSGLGAWRIARSWQMHQALSNKVLDRYGFVLPWTFAKANRKAG